MANQFNGSTPVNADNLNCLIRGDGSLKGLQLFSLYIAIKNNGGTMQYILRTNSATGDWRNLSDIGATEESSYTNMGDGNVDRVSAGNYKITGLSTINNMFLVSSIRQNTDSNVVNINFEADVSANEILIETQNNVGANTEIADTKTIEAFAFGFFN